MTEQEKLEIIQKAKSFFKERVVANHIKNSEKLRDVSKFNINPFTHRYLSNFAFGDASSKNLAKTLIYPRVLGTSIATTFGTQLQFFCHEVLSSYASTTPGIDIEFIDCLDKRKKYCQIKSGPTTINYDDVETICNHFTDIKNIARTNRLMDFNPMFDCVVGVFYGSEQELSGCYKNIAKEYPVLIGKDFWYHLTGDENFYAELINAFAEVAMEMDGSELLEDIINELAKKIDELI